MSKISIFVLCISFCQIVFSQSLIKHFTAIPSDYVPELTVEERLKMINTQISIFELVPQLKVASYDILLDLKKIQEIDGGYYKTLQSYNKYGFNDYHLDISISKVNKELSIKHCWWNDLPDKIIQNKTIIDKGAQTYYWSESSGTYRQ